MRKKVFAFIFSAFFISAVFSQEIPSELRGGIQADSTTIQKALEMKNQGWTYVMPKPKSAQAAWGNRDGRTTWWVGYWTNEKTNETSSAEPELKNGKYVGNGQGSPVWRRGGTPPPPTKIEWLLSKGGGIKPQER
jgi:hypothetical protein